MSLVLAIEPDRKQAAQLANVVRRMVKAELILVDAAEDAVDTLRTRVPDLVLVPALLSPRDDAALSEALRAAAGPASVRVLITPRLAHGKTSIGAGLIGKWRRNQKADAGEDGCDPQMFADQIKVYLEEPHETRASEHVPAMAAADAIEAPPRLDETKTEEEPFAADAWQNDEEPAPRESWESLRDEQPPFATIEQPPFEPVEYPPVEPVTYPPAESFGAPPVQSAEYPPVESIQQPPVEPSEPPPLAAIEQRPFVNGQAPPLMEAAAAPVAAVLNADEVEWQRLIASLQRAVDGFRVEEWFARPVKPKAVPDEWGFYDPDKCGIGALMDQLDAAARDQQRA